MVALSLIWNTLWRAVGAALLGSAASVIYGTPTFTQEAGTSSDGAVDGATIIVTGTRIAKEAPVGTALAQR